MKTERHHKRPRTAGGAGERFSAKNQSSDRESIGIPGFASAESFKRELEREILRSDRTGVPLTLLLFGVDYEDGPQGTMRFRLESIARSVQERARRTDSKGWYFGPEGRRVALLLYDTRPEAAHRIIDLIRLDHEAALDNAGVNGRVREVKCEFFTYPDKESNVTRRVERGAQTEPNPKVAVIAEPDRFESDAELGKAEAEARTPIKLEACDAADVIAPGVPFWKRGLDLILGTIVLLVTSPVMLVIALVVRLTSSGPVLFRQERVGRFGRKFVCLKFRTMTNDSDPSTHKRYLETLISQSGEASSGAEAPMVKLDSVDDQITAVGRVLRATCLDELPQIFNVLRGQMSLVGPRPCLPYEAEVYLRWHRRRFDALPGVTGLWQVRGKNKTTFTQMIRYDIEYQRNLSLWQDIKIIFLTVPAILSEVREGLAPTAPADQVELDSAR